MADQLTLDVIDRPAGGALGAMRRLGALRRAAPAGTRAEERHRTEWFLRLRPLAERGSLAGAAPFRDVIAPRVTA